MAHLLGWDPSKVSRMESGKLGFNALDVSAYLAVCRVTGEHRKRILEMVTRANDADLLRTHRGRLPDQLKVLIRHEWDADAIFNYEPFYVPGLLQTPEYTRELMRGSGRVRDEDIEPRVAARMAQKEIMRGEFPTPCAFLIHENALRCQTENPEIMRGQLFHLIFMATRPCANIRVVTTAVGMGAAPDAFMIMDLPDRRSVVHLEALGASVFLEQKTDIAFYRSEWKRLAGLALDEAESRVFLAALANELGAPGRTEDDLPDFLEEE
ncbi:hypothetical protein LX83_002203 [Goodfellowiella coeruleoviolacea]|uniref:DUF5753 domain-containing protein n=2 Tax=Goodfellowiella coeruleoviolacea TaxID=334858 RepID=A0AAE3GDG6_9PSEU|nr:hypothetical protein [Goodfellowiella coeruleoviolacea]